MYWLGKFIKFIRIGCKYFYDDDDYLVRQRYYIRNYITEYKIPDGEKQPDVDYGIRHVEKVYPDYIIRFNLYDDCITLIYELKHPKHDYSYDRCTWDTAHLMYKTVIINKNDDINIVCIIGWGFINKIWIKKKSGESIIKEIEMQPYDDILDQCTTIYDTEFNTELENILI